MKIQHEWVKARVKGDSSYTRRIEADDCTIVWPDGRIVNKRQDLRTMIGDIVLPNSKSMIFGYAYTATLESVGAGIIKAQKGKKDLLDGNCLDRHICEKGWRMEGYSFADHSSIGKIIADVYP